MDPYVGTTGAYACIDTSPITACEQAMATGPIPAKDTSSFIEKSVRSEMQTPGVAMDMCSFGYHQVLLHSAHQVDRYYNGITNSEFACEFYRAVVNIFNNPLKISAIIKSIKLSLSADKDEDIKRNHIV